MKTGAAGCCAHSQWWYEVRQAVPQVGVVSEGVIREQGRHSGTRLGSVEHQHQHGDV